MKAFQFIILSELLLFTLIDISHEAYASRALTPGQRVYIRMSQHQVRTKTKGQGAIRYLFEIPSYAKGRNQPQAAFMILSNSMNCCMISLILKKFLTVMFELALSISSSTQPSEVMNHGRGKGWPNYTKNEVQIPGDCVMPP